MCYHVQLPKKEELTPEELSVFADDNKLIEEYNRYYHLSAFDHGELPIVAQEAPQEVRAYRWGLIPHWVQNREKADELSNLTLNATCEGVFDKPSFRESVYRKRCVVLIKGFFENRHEGKLKYPYFIYAADGGLLRLGGLYNEWTDTGTGELLRTVTLVTTPANPLLEKIHNTKKRMPLILTPHGAREWLTPGLTREEVTALMVPCKENMLKAHTISRRINQSRFRNTNVPEITEPLEYPELALLD